MQYHKLNSEPLKKYLDNVFLDLKKQGVSYYALGVQDYENNRSTSIMSNTEWQDNFINQKLFEHDPLRRAMINTNKQIILFEELTYKLEMDYHVMEERKKFNISNGLAIVVRNGSYKYIVTVASDYSKFRPESFILNNREKMIKIFSEVNTLFPFLSS